MTKEEITKAVENLKKIRKQFNKYEFTHSIDLAIDALEEQERPTLRHVIINHPRYGESDAWYDEARQIVFQHWVSKEYANTLGWKIEEADDDSSK